jgi:hypothetical protein
MMATFGTTARRVGVYSAIWVAALLTAYAITLGLGLASLESPDDPIGGPLFTALELLIIAIAPAMVAMMAAVHAWAPTTKKPLSLSAVAFMTVVAVITCSVHFVVLTVSRHPAFADLPSLDRWVSFEWPSVAYALDILAWDFFFPLSMLFAAPVFSGRRVARWLRILMIVSGVLALSGLSGVVAGDMRLRNIGIVGYVPVFVAVTILLAILFYRSPAVDDRAGRQRYLLPAAGSPQRRSSRSR